MIRGQVFRSMGKHERALENFRLAAERDPNSNELHHQSAHVLQELKRFDEALAEIEQALALSPGHHEGHFLVVKGDCLVSLARKDEAKAAFERALQTGNPGDKQAAQQKLQGLGP